MRFHPLRAEQKEYEEVRNDVFFTSAKHFRDAISEFFDTTVLKIAQSLSGRINDDFQTINPVPSS